MNSEPIDYSSRPAPRQKSGRFFIISAIILLIIAGVAKFVFILCTPTGVLSDAYHGFLQDGNSNIFFSFEREQLIPKRLSGAPAFKPVNDNDVKMSYNTANREYRALCRCGRYFVAAYSGKSPFLKPTDITNAEVLLGFDGSYYWRLTLVSTASDSPSRQTINSLILVPVSEATRKQDVYRVDVVLQSMKIVEQECARAVQFGYSGDLAKPPQLNGATLNVEGMDGVAQNAVVVGSIGKPDEIDYLLGPNSRMAVALTAGTDTMTITRWFKQTIFTQERILGIAFAQASQSPPPGIFAWETYKGTVKNLVAGLITNGMDMEVIFSSPSSAKFHLGRVRLKAEPPPAHDGRI